MPLLGRAPASRNALLPAANRNHLRLAERFTSWYRGVEHHRLPIGEPDALNLGGSFSSGSISAVYESIRFDMHP